MAIPREFFENLSDPQKEKAITLFEKYRDIFSKNDFDLGCAANIEHKVDTQGHAPFKARPIQRSCASNEEVTSEIQKLVDNGLFVKLNSPWALLLLLVKKKDRITRVTIDYCELKYVTKKDSYPLPQIDNTTNKLGGA